MVSREMINRSVTIRDKDVSVVDKKAINLSKFLRKQLEEEYADEYKKEK